jgi:hypothetical protein
MKEADVTETLIQLPVQCPACGKREARRVAVWRLELYHNANPERTVETIRCKCGCQYVITARAYQEPAA